MKESRCTIQVSMVMVALLVVANASMSQADQGDYEVQVNVSGMKTGVVTDVMAQAVVINGKAYGVIPDVVVVNQYGKSDGLDSLRKDIRVYFHLYEDKVDKSEKIDRMVLINPQ